uniref:Superoxide dismutase copper/zinc binding domain-containing protein n=1 Tax=Denticeps clupeoides TaxID=299321 RepID=A0AAY4DVX7_9TELE
MEGSTLFSHCWQRVLPTNFGRDRCKDSGRPVLCKAKCLWFGDGHSTGQIKFSQVSAQGLTALNVSLSNLGSMAGGYHVHILPILNKTMPCSNDNIMGHYNPFSINISAGPPPTAGTTDQYEIGDISGKFGMLTNLNEQQGYYMDSNMPLLGPNSIIGRSLVIHYTNGSRLTTFFFIFIQLGFL